MGRENLIYKAKTKRSWKRALKHLKVSGIPQYVNGLDGTFEISPSIFIDDKGWCTVHVTCEQIFKSNFKPKEITLTQLLKL